MAAGLGLHSLTPHLQKLTQQQHQQPQSNMWDYAARLPLNDDDDSWEVRAFARDTSNAMGTTWPPRSYTCTFCGREFRSAQALGGHMNVHRRDRARLRQSPQVSDPSPSYAAATTSSPAMIFSSSEFVANGGVFFYPIQTPAGSVPVPATHSSPSTFLSISPYAQAANLPASSSNLCAYLLAKVGTVRDDSEGKESSSDDGGVVEVLDLELRLGW